MRTPAVPVRPATWLLKATMLWIALLIGSILGAAVTGLATMEPGPGSRTPDGPLSSGVAFLLVTALQAALLALIAAHARRGGGWLAIVLFVVLFGAQTALMQVEAVFFSDHVAMPLALIPRILASAALAAAIAAVAAALLFRPPSAPPTAIRGLAWRIPLLALVYAALYFAAGYLIAWQYPDLREFYGEGVAIDLGALTLMQCLRGLAWAALALLLVRHLIGPVRLRAVTVALAFAVFAAAQLLHPNPWMPWSVRLPHLVEVALANALFGCIAVVVLMRGQRTAASKSPPPEPGT
jgi:hypothetical protein